MSEKLKNSTSEKRQKLTLETLTDLYEKGNHLNNLDAKQNPNNCKNNMLRV